MAQLIVVTGMHRSGTSALAEVLVHAGAWFGDPMLAAPGRQRPLGLVERTDFLALSEAAMRACGARWHDVFGFRPAWETQKAQALRQRFASELLPDLLARNVSVLKDPRLSFLLPLFLPAMPTDTVVVLIVRHPLEVAMSLAARNGFSIPFGVALWEAYNRHAALLTRQLTSVFIPHRQLIREPDTSIRELIAKLAHLGITGLDGEAAIAANTIEHGLYRQKSVRRQGDELAPAQRAFWKALRCASTPADVPISELSAASASILAKHHENPVVPRPGRPDDS
ncbi:MAG TPA: sulfotransferase [Rhizomicrobium sp.]|nr:sulfotransferase [Rhizomicrobium sp.]